MKTYDLNSYTYFFLSIKHVEYYLNYIMNNPNLIPKKLLVHNQKNIMDRIIINAMKSRNGKLYSLIMVGGHIITILFIILLGRLMEIFISLMM